jgi:hypothetical protein
MVAEHRRAYDQISSLSEQADTRALVEQVFNSAWKSLAASERWRHVSTEQSENLKTLLMNKITDMAAAGETNPKILRARALEAIALSTD